MTVDTSQQTAYVPVIADAPAMFSQQTAYVIIYDSSLPQDVAVADNTLQKLRAWGFSLDGHDFYVLTISDRETAVCDLVTGQWAMWNGNGAAIWRALHSANWIGIGGDVLTDYGSRSNVVVGDNAAGVLWFLDPALAYDQGTDLTETPFDRIVTGGAPMRMRDTVRCNEVYLTAQKGVEGLSANDPTLTLETSDDAGQTWVDQGTIDVVAGDYSQEFVWRSLGLIGAPGRLFRLTDNCIARIDGLDMR